MILWERLLYVSHSSTSVNSFTCYECLCYPLSVSEEVRGTEGEVGRRCGSVQWCEGEEWRGVSVWGSETGRIGGRNKALMMPLQ